MDNVACVGTLRLLYLCRDWVRNVIIFFYKLGLNNENRINFEKCSCKLGSGFGDVNVLFTGKSKLKLVDINLVSHVIVTLKASYPTIAWRKSGISKT